jgi:molybdopterin/thiamine biosynthesis adenylyltransferase
MITSERYARLEAVPAIGRAGLKALQDARVAILGVGNVGGQLAQHLVLLGARLVLVDRDVVTEANLGTQGFTEDDIGRPKAGARAEWLGPLNPRCRIEPVHADIRRLGLGALRGITLLFSCLDSRAGRATVSELAMRLGIPWIDGALDGSGTSYFGRVACYDPRRPESACYLCPHDAASLQGIADESGAANGCSTRRWIAAEPAPPPTLACSALGGAVAAMQAIWGLQMLLGRSDEVAGREVYFDLGQSMLTSHRLRRNPRCVLDHRSWQLAPMGAESSASTVEQTFSFAESALAGAVDLQLVHRAIVTRLRCARCGAEQHPYLVAEVLREEHARCACGGGMDPVAADVLDRFGRSQAAPLLARTWEEIGLPRADVIVARSDGADLHVLLDA